MEKSIKLLLVTYSPVESVLDKQLLEDQGFCLVESDNYADIAFQCTKSGIDIIIAEPHAERETEFLHNNHFLQDTPLLWLGPQSTTWNSGLFGGTVFFTSQHPDDREIQSHLNSLVEFRRLHRIIQEKNIQLKELTDQHNRHQKSVEEHSQFLDILATRDGLTGLYNRRHLNTVLPNEINRCMECQTDLSILILDIDYLNEINKSVGISYGDFVLNDFAARLTATVHPKGICFRFSGEIFISLLPSTDLNHATYLAESLRNDLKNKPFVRLNEKRIVTFSAGIVSLFEHHPDDQDEFLAMAEKALFAAKSEGRDRIVPYRPVSLDGSPQQDVLFLKQTLSKILERTRTSAIDSLQLLAKDIAGEKNRYHIKNVRHYVELLGQHMELPTPIVQTFKNAITLHTSIRFLLHNEMINKKEPFSTDDRETMDDFPFKLAEIIEMFEYFSSERAILLYHSERYDGTGYPDGLKGDEIPLGARIFSIVDALAAMNSERPHRDRLKPSEIISELTHGAGTQFDPSLVIKVFELIKKQRMLKIKYELIDHSIDRIRQSFPDATL